MLAVFDKFRRAGREPARPEYPPARRKILTCGLLLLLSMPAAAGMNHAGAQAKLGYLYTDGSVVPQDSNKAFDFYGKAARSARDNFPRAIQKADQLWIRQVGKVQEQVKE